MEKTFNILIIKCEPRIDVLRATALLTTLRAAYSDAKIHWITSRRNRFILDCNDKIDRLLNIEDGSTIAVGMNIRFDLLINLDVSFTARNIAGLAKAERKIGFCIDSAGQEYILNPESQLISDYEDDPTGFSHSNELSYQQILLKSCGFDQSAPGEMILKLPEKPNKLTKEFAEKNDLAGNKSDVIAIYMGFNPRFGKSYLPPKPISFIAEFFNDRKNTKVIVMTGPAEKQLYEDAIVQCPPGVIEGGHANSISTFRGILELCDLVISPDSLALHCAQALGKNVIALLDESNETNIELYSRTIPFISPSEASDVESDIRYFTNIQPDSVFEAGKRLLDDNYTSHILS